MDCKQININQCDGQFRSSENFIQPKWQVIPYTQSSIILNPDMILMQYFLNYVITISQNLPRQLPIPLNLFNVNVLPTINLPKKILYNQTVIQNRFLQKNISKPCIDKIILRELTISRKQCDNIKSIDNNLKDSDTANISIKQCDNVKSILDNNLKASGTADISIKQCDNVKSILDNNLKASGTADINIKQCDNVKSILDNNLKASNIIFSIDDTNTSANTNKKRQQPDYDDYHLVSRKRAKPFLREDKFCNDDFRILKNTKCMSVVKPSEGKNSIDIVKNKWNVTKISDPHIDYTTRIIPSNSVKTRERICNEERSVSCLLIFDEEIEKMEEDITYTSQEMNNLEIEISKRSNYEQSCQIYDQIVRLSTDVNYCKNRYGSLCEARDEVYQLYANKKRTLSFTSELITRSELQANNEIRQIFNKYKEFYGSW